MSATQTLERPSAVPHDAPGFALIDTHAHLDGERFDADRGQVFARARAADVGVVLMSTTLEAAPAVVAMAEEHRAWCAVGIHPEAAGTADAGLEARLRTLAQAERVVAIGEIGLDYYWESHPRPVQHDVFRRQLRLALELGLPVSIHNRDAGADAIAIVAEFPGVRGVFHSFLGTPDEARAVLDLGLFLGIGGPLTFKKGEALRETVRGVPLERIVLETDSPYLTPEPHRGKRNEPAYVRHVAEALAELKGVSPDAVARQTSANASALFGL